VAVAAARRPLRRAAHADLGWRGRASGLEPLREEFGQIRHAGAAHQLDDRQVDAELALEPISQLDGHERIDAEVQERPVGFEPIRGRPEHARHPLAEQRPQ
jgi:hypothetical protein